MSLSAEKWLFIELSCFIGLASLNGGEGERGVSSLPFDAQERVKGARSGDYGIADQS
ncbi:hypothetical protein [Acetobacter ghanensis]|uniref:hypothetical protein n=1 Tax=Acetobacter ghanensis TaxID=431306 RepID=UPI001E2C2E6F|nr:hypothetical protein [Acetobacter ghanensis]